MNRHIPGTLFLRNLLERRSLLLQLVRRDFEQRFVGSAMGWIWGLVHPLVLLTSWFFVFQVCLRQPPPPGVSNYALWIFAGMLPWALFSETVQRSSSSLLDQAGLITKTVFPSEIVPVSVFLSMLISHLLALGLIVVVIAIWTQQASFFLVLLPVYMLALGLFAVGLGWIAAGLHVYLRDTAQMVSVLMTLWFWLTPIFISPESYPKRLRILLEANPLYYLVKGYREVLLDNRIPDFSGLGMALLLGSVVFVAGGFFFRHMKRGFADVL